MNKDHIPALDGIRGVAVILVLLVHFIPPVAMQWRVAEWFMKIFSTGGWIGVDLFFVLSGFLITGILLRTRKEPDYFKNFYMRRTLRIVPVYFLALFILFGVLPLFISTPRFSVLQENQLYFWLYATNIGLFTVGRDAMNADVAAPAIYWSLAIEEHFYLIWPAVVFFCSTRTLKTVCISLIVASFAIRCIVILALGERSLVLFLTPCKMDGLAAGALVAVFLHESGMTALQAKIKPAAIAIAVLSGILLAYFLYMKGLWAGHWFIVVFGIPMLVAVFSSVLIVAVAAPSSILARLLSSRPLRFFGKYSYGMYVIHALILPGLLVLLPTEHWFVAFGDQPLLASLTLTGAKIAITTVLAVLSFHFYEARFLRIKHFFEPASSRVPSGAIGSGIAAKGRPLPHQNPRYEC